MFERFRVTFDLSTRLRHKYNNSEVRFGGIKQRCIWIFILDVGRTVTMWQKTGKKKKKEARQETEKYFRPR